MYIISCFSMIDRQGPGCRTFDKGPGGSAPAERAAGYGNTLLVLSREWMGLIGVAGIIMNI